MKKTILIFLLIFSSAFFNVSFAKEDNQLDQIIAIVNDEVITQSELNHRLAIAKIQIAQEHLTVPSPQALQKQVLDQLINKKLQMQVAKQVGINTSEEDVDQVIGRIAQQNQVSVNDLYDRLRQEGMSITDYRQELRDQVTLQKLQQQEVISKITISPEEVANFMRSKTWKNNTSKEYNLEDILIPTSDTPSPEEIAKARRKAESLVAKIKQGQDFNVVAQSESGDTHALSGGDLGWRKLPEIPNAFAEHVVGMQKKEIAGPIQTANGFHIIRLVGVRDVDQKGNAPTTDQIKHLLLQRKFEEAVQNWVSKLRSQSFVKVTSENA